MSSTFEQIPATRRRPFVSIELGRAASFEAPGILKFNCMIFAQKLSEGSAPENEPVFVVSGQETELFGAGSMAQAMCKAYFKNTKNVSLYVWPATAAAGSVAASGSFAFSGPATAGGTQVVYVADKAYRVVVPNETTADTVATLVAAKINSDPERLVDATATAAEVSVTARNEGAVFNELRLRTKVHRDDRPVPGISVVITDMADGVGEPDYGPIVANLGDRWYNIVANPYVSSPAYTTLEDHVRSMEDASTARDSVIVQTAVGAFGAITALGDARNSKHQALFAPGEESVTPPFLITAALAGAIGEALEADPAANMNNLEIRGVVPPLESARFTPDEREALLFEGVSTTVVDFNGALRVELPITNYRIDGQGIPDDSYLSLNVPFQAAFCRWKMSVDFATVHPNKKLGDDDGLYDPNEPIVTPSLAEDTVRDTLIWLERRAIIENSDDMQVTAQRDSENDGRLNIFCEDLDYVNQLSVVAMRLGYK